MHRRLRQDQTVMHACGRLRHDQTVVFGMRPGEGAVGDGRGIHRA